MVEDIRALGRHWFFNYLCKELELQIDKKAFPYESSQSDLEQIINIRVDDIYMADYGNEELGVSGRWKILPQLDNLSEHSVFFDEDNYNKDAQIGIKKIVKALWPDYVMEENLWNRKNPGERSVHSKLRKVMDYFANNYEYPDCLHIPTKTGRVARYAHSTRPMKIDGISRDLWYIIEVQGDYHYKEGLSSTASYVGSIPACYTGNATTFLEYRQEQDAKCKRAMKRHGFSPVYIPITKWAKPVKGVHGDLLPWNYRYVSGGSTKSIGLAELFDIQGRKDVGDMIREYHQNVVMKMTKEMKRKLEE